MPWDFRIACLSAAFLPGWLVGWWLACLVGWLLDGQQVLLEVANVTWLHSVRTFNIFIAVQKDWDRFIRNLPTGKRCIFSKRILLHRQPDGSRWSKLWNSTVCFNWHANWNFDDMPTEILMTCQLKDKKLEANQWVCKTRNTKVYALWFYVFFRQIIFTLCINMGDLFHLRYWTPPHVTQHICWGWFEIEWF